MKEFPFSLSLITDFTLIAENEIETVIESALRGGVDLVQFRDSGSSPERRLKRAKRVKSVTGKKVPLIINSDPSLMKQLDADGVQVKSRDLDSLSVIRERIGPDKYLGASVHNENELLLADKSGADFLVLSPLFPPGSKPGVSSSLGEDNFRKLCSLTNIPVLALGGLNMSNAEVPLSCGAQGVSMITGILRGADIYQAAKKIRQKISYRTSGL